LTPFLFAALLAYLGDPLIDRLEARKIPRGPWRCAGFRRDSTRAVALLLFLIPLLTHQFKGLMQRLPALYRLVSCHHMLPWMQDTLGIDPESVQLQPVAQARN
jgi:predicted PurR-regulated permease PerM